MSTTPSRILGSLAAIAALPLALVSCSPLNATPVGTPTPVVTETAAPIDPEKPDDEADVPVVAGFVELFDDSGVLSVNVPATWTDVETGPIDGPNGSTLENIAASPDLEGFSTGWDVPGMSLSATQDPDVSMQDFTDSLISSVAPQCEDGETGDYDDGVYVGSYLFFPNCGETSTEFLAIITEDSFDPGTIVVVTIQMVSDEDKTTVSDEILASFFAIYD